MTSSPRADPQDSRREQAECIYFARVEQAVSGIAFDLEGLCEQHPELAEELRALHASRGRALEALAGAGLADDPDEAPLAQEPLTFRFGADRYEIRRPLARGGMGVILEVWDRNLGRPLAMKMLHGLQAGSDEASRLRTARRRSRLLNEAEILGQLDHPAIVPVIDVGTTADDELFFTMQLVRGGSFHDVIRTVHEGTGEWTLARAVGVIMRVCEAMAHAHARGVLHRDLKPENIMVGPFGEVYVMDWGLAKAKGSRDGADLRLRGDFTDHGAGSGNAPAQAHGPGESVNIDADALADSVRTARRDDSDSDPLSPLVTLDGDVLGTPAYMPPEQAAGRIEALDSRSDVYSVGAMLYHLLAGHPPYAVGGRRSAPREVLARALDGPPEPIGRTAARVPAELIAICEKAIARRPDQRYPEAAHLAADLRAWREGRVVQAHRTGALTELRKWVGRHRGTAAAVLIATLGVLALVIIQSVFAERISDANRALKDSNAGLTDANTAQRRQLYRNDIAMSERALKDGDVSRALDRLAGAPVEFRNWEWAFLHRRLNESDVSLPVVPFEEVLMAQWSPDGTRLAAGTAQGSLLVWSLADLNAEPYRVNVGNRPMSVVFLPDGKLVTVDSGNRAGLWDGEGAECLQWIELGTSGLSWSDGRTLQVSGLDGGNRAWDLKTGERLPDPPLPLPGMPAAPIHSDFTFSHVFRFERPLQAVSVDGERAVVIHDDWTLSVHDGTGARLAHLSEPAPNLRFLMLAPGGRRLAVGIDGSIVLRDLGDGNGDVAISNGIHNSHLFAWRPDGRECVVRTGSLMRLYREDDQWERPVTLAASRQSAAAYAPDGGWLATASHSGSTTADAQIAEVKLWDLERFERLNRVQLSQTQVRHVALSPDQTRLATVALDGRLAIVDIATGDVLDSVTGEHELLSVSWTRDGTRIAVGTDHGRVRIYPADDLSEPREIHAAGGRIDRIAFFDDDRKMVLPSNADHVVCRDVGTGSTIWNAEYPGARIVWADVSSDESLVAVAGFEARRAYLLDAVTGRELRRWTTQGKCGVVHFSPDGKRLLIVGRRTSLWNLSEERFEWENKLSSPRLFTPDGSRLIGGANGLLDVYEVDTGERVLSFETVDANTGIFDISRDGQTVFGTTAGGFAAWWDATPWTPSKP